MERSELPSLAFGLLRMISNRRGKKWISCAQRYCNRFQSLTKTLNYTKVCKVISYPTIWAMCW
jgi:hypothetical protein